MHPETQQASRAPQATLLIASCAIVALAYWLGAAWLSNRVLALPAGLWAVAVVFATLRWGEPLILDTWLARFNHRGSSILARVRELLPTIIDPLATVPARIAAAARSARDGWNLADAASHDHARTSPDPEFNARTPALGASNAWRNDRIRVGLELPDHVAKRLMHSPGVKRIDWVQLRDPDMQPHELCRLHRLDAVVHRIGDSICATPADASTFEPAWHDWVSPTRPVSYASVFPMRADAARVSLGETDFTDPVERELASAIIRALVHLRREPLRLAADRHQPAPTRCPLRYLARLIVDRERSHSTLESYRAACRAVSAYLSVTTVQWSDADVLDIVAACRRTLPDEPEILLRSAAVRFVRGDDDAALEAVSDADHLLRTAGGISPQSQLPFVQSELNMGGDDPLAFGRIAAGLCLCTAPASDAELTFLRDDLLDEARFSEWLIGRDAERFVLMRVFGELLHQRDASQPTLFQAA